MKPFARSDRVGGQIQKVLSEILLKKVKDPRLENASITDVKMSRDLRIARIYFCLLYTSPSPRDRTRSRMPSSA